MAPNCFLLRLRAQQRRGCQLRVTGLDALTAINRSWGACGPSLYRSGRALAKHILERPLDPLRRSQVRRSSGVRVVTTRQLDSSTRDRLF
jgi:hypothetical protein